GEGKNGVAITGGAGRLLQPGRIIGKAERIRRADVELGLFRGPLIGEDRGVLAGPNATVEATVRANVEVAHELLAKVGVTTLVTLLPGVGGNLVFFVPRQPGLLLFAEPSHARNLRERGRVCSG